MPVATSHLLRVAVDSVMVYGELAARRHRANNAKNALSQFRRGDDSLSNAIPMLVSVPNIAPPNTSVG